MIGLKYKSIFKYFVYYTTDMPFKNIVKANLHLLDKGVIDNQLPGRQDLPSLIQLSKKFEILQFCVFMKL